MCADRKKKKLEMILAKIAMILFKDIFFTKKIMNSLKNGQNSVINSRF